MLYKYILYLYIFIRKLKFYFYPIEYKKKLYDNIYLYKIYNVYINNFCIYINGYYYYIKKSNEKIKYNDLKKISAPGNIESIYINYIINKLDYNIEDKLDDKLDFHQEITFDDFIFVDKEIYDLLNNYSKVCKIKDIIFYYLKYNKMINIKTIINIKIKFDNIFFTINLDDSLSESYKNIEKVLDE